MSCDDAGTKPVQRFEVFTGAGRRRVWEDEVKAAIVAESYSGHETVCAVARRHGLSHSQLFTWRRQMRQKAEVASRSVDRSMFVPAVLDLAVSPVAAPPQHPRRQARRSSKAAIELEMDGVTMKIARGADPDTISAVIAALRATR
ncbi:IS66-like element accessory protein TnpA [Pacificimonas sp. ICDLI1SI03]